MKTKIDTILETLTELRIQFGSAKTVKRRSGNGEEGSV